MHRGYLALWRRIEDHPFYKERREFSKLEAWIDILMQVQHEESEQDVIFGMTIIRCNYGESLKSIMTWAKRWQWSESKVRRFLKLLEKMKQIELKSEGITTRIIVLNYYKYDPKRRTNDGCPTDERRMNDEQTTTDKHAKHAKHDNNNIPPISPKRKKSVQKPETVSDDVWNDFIVHRKEKKAPLTKSALAGIQREAVKANWILEDALMECMTRGWIGFKADWVNKPNGNAQKINNDGSEIDELDVYLEKRRLSRERAQ